MTNKPIGKMTNKQLANEYEAMIEQIENIGCFGVKDVIYAEQIEKEINKRGFEIQRITKISLRRT